MNQHQIKYMPLSELTVGRNTRVLASNRFEEMAESVEDRGIDEPIQVWKNPDTGDTEILRGHRRYAGASIVAKRSPDIFKGHFPNGVPVIIRKDVTNASEAALAKVDHGTVVGLKYRCERDLAVAILKDEGCTEEEICARLEGLFGKFQTSVPTAKRDKLDELKKSPIKNRRQIRKLVHETYKGQLQASIAVYKCPEKVAQCLRHLEAKEPLPDGVKCPAKMTYGDVKTLSKAVAEDNAIKDDKDMPKYSKGNPGPNFRDAWDALLKQEPKVEGTRAKGMSAKAMQAQLDDGAWDSEGFKLLTMSHAGAQDVKGLKDADQRLYACDLVSKHDSELWKQFGLRAAAIKKSLVEGTAPSKA